MADSRTVSSAVPPQRAQVEQDGFNEHAVYPYALRPDVFSVAMEDIYAMLGAVNESLTERGLLRLEESVRGAIFSGLLSDMLTEAVAKHSQGLCKNQFSNGHPDLLPAGRYVNDEAQSAPEGVEVKVTKKAGGGVDMHGARPAWLCVFRYVVDYVTQPVIARQPTRFTDVWLYQTTLDDFRHNPRGPLGTRTASLDREGLARMRARWIYHVD